MKARALVVGTVALTFLLTSPVAAQIEADLTLAGTDDRGQYTIFLQQTTSDSTARVFNLDVTAVKTPFGQQVVGGALEREIWGAVLTPDERLLFLPTGVPSPAEPLHVVPGDPDPYAPRLVLALSQTTVNHAPPGVYRIFIAFTKPTSGRPATLTELLANLVTNVATYDLAIGSATSRIVAVRRNSDTQNIHIARQGDPLSLFDVANRLSPGTTAAPLTVDLPSSQTSMIWQAGRSSVILGQATCTVVPNATYDVVWNGSQLTCSRR